MPSVKRVAARVCSHFSPSQASLKAALEAARAGLWEWDLITDENRWSDDVWVLYGLDKKMHPPSYDSWLHSIHPDDRERAQRIVQGASFSRQSMELEWRTNPELGPVRWVLSRGQPLAQGQGEATNYTGIVMDITARKEAERALQQLNLHLEERVKQRTHALQEHERLLQHMLDGVPGLVGYWSEDLTNRFANRAYGEWFGMSSAELRGKHIRELLGAEIYRKNLPFIEGALRGEKQCFERELPMPSAPGEFRVTEAHYLPDLVDGHVCGFFVMVFDITAIKRSERQAEAASQAKSDFLANISHELRTPLNAIFGLAQLGVRDGSHAPPQHVFQQILESGQHLLGLVNDVLDFSKIEAGKLQLTQEDMDLGQLIEHLVAMTHLRAQAKGLAWVIHESPRVPRRIWADGTRIAQIMLNLVTNAIKFTDVGSVTVSMDMQGDVLTLDVTDTGIGIAPHDLQRLFKPFEQVHKAQIKHPGGTGLGLAISQRLAKLMHGDITVSSVPGVGTRFTLRMPVGRASPADTSSLSPMVTLGISSAALAPLAAALEARHGHILSAEQALQPGCHPRLVLIHESEPEALNRQPVRHWLAQGAQLVVWTQEQQWPSSAVAWPRQACMISGPLSPLRLLHALDQHAPASSGEKAAAHLRGLRVLAAEDNPINRLVLEQMLHQEGAIVSFAADGEQALELVRQRGPGHFDVVLCDIQMPVMDGYQTTQALQHLAPGLPVIGLTAHAFANARAQARESGMVDFVTKPYMLETLVSTVLRHARHPELTPDEAHHHNVDHDPMLNDWQAMLQQFGTKPELLERLVAQLRQTLPANITQLDQACEAADMLAIAHQAHEIKGLALNLRAAVLASLAIQAQDQARQRHPESVPSGRQLALGLRQFLAHVKQGQGMPAKPCLSTPGGLA
jgi:PAS domain S-box-containing protein